MIGIYFYENFLIITKKKLQKKCVRIISKASYNSHAQPLFFSLDILPLPDIIIQQQLLITHSIDQKYSIVDNDVFF